MGSFNSMFFGVLILLVTVTNVLPLKCYMCSLCNDPFDKSSASIETCLGTCIKAKRSGNVVRTCSPIGVSVSDRCEEADDATGCTCTSDLCNSASGIYISLPVVCVSAIVILLGMF